jgi:adenylate cyclase
VQPTSSESSSEVHELPRFKSDIASKVFSSLVDSFIEDYASKKYVPEKSGWRTLTEIASKTRISTSVLYGKHTTVGPALDEPIREGLIETRLFAGERGRGGEVTRLRIAYDNVSIQDFVNRKAFPGRKGATARAGELDRLRVAVLPFVSMSPDPNDEYFADGLTEELITRISLVRGLKVIARTSVMGYKKKEMNVSQIGRELNVGTLLEGSVRKAGNKIRVSAQLINANTEDHLWAENYDRDLQDIFEVQSSVAHKVAGALKLKLLDGDRERVETTENIESYTLYLRATQLIREGTLATCQQAIALYEGAISMDPTFSRAYAGLAGAWYMMWTWNWSDFNFAVNRAEAAALRALELGPEFAETHSAMAIVHQAKDRFDEAHLELKRAIRINPNLAGVNQLLGWNSAIFGRFDESIIYLRKACSLDPLGTQPMLILIAVLRAAGRIDEALEFVKEIEKFHPKDPAIYTTIAAYYLQKRDFAQAMDATDLGLKLDPGDHLLRMYRGVAYAMSGRREEAIDELRELKKDKSESNRLNAQVWINTALGNIDDAFKALMKQAELHAWWGLIKFDPLLERLRNDSRFSEFCEKVGLPP